MRDSYLLLVDQVYSVHRRHTSEFEIADSNTERVYCIVHYKGMSKPLGFNARD